MCLHLHNVYSALVYSSLPLHSWPAMVWMHSAVTLMCRQAALTPPHIPPTWTFTPSPIGCWVSAQIKLGTGANCSPITIRRHLWEKMGHWRLEESFILWWGKKTSQVGYPCHASNVGSHQDHRGYCVCTHSWCVHTHAHTHTIIWCENVFELKYCLFSYLNWSIYLLLLHWWVEEEKKKHFLCFVLCSMIRISRIGWHTLINFFFHTGLTFGVFAGGINQINMPFLCRIVSRHFPISSALTHVFTQRKA